MKQYTEKELKEIIENMLNEFDDCNIEVGFVPIKAITDVLEDNDWCLDGKRWNDDKFSVTSHYTCHWCDSDIYYKLDCLTGESNLKFVNGEK